MLDGLKGNEHLSKREFMKAALAIGGTSALSACLSRKSTERPRGVREPAELPARQHAWNAYLVQDPHGNTILPHHQLLLFLDYTGDTAPSDAERQEVESALRTIERAYQWGTGGNRGAMSNDGLLFSLGYSPHYFTRLESYFPDDVDLPSSERLIEELDEETATADEFDAVLLLTSDHVEMLLTVELALFGHLDKVNGVLMESGFTGIFAKRKRRTGFVGQGVVSKFVDSDLVPEESPQAMGYKSGFRDNQAAESKVTIQSGVFSGGTTQQISRLVFDLEPWYDLSERQRVDRMFSPHHSAELVGQTGDFLASDSRVTPELTENLAEDAKERGTLGHTQKVAQARDDSFEPRILRRSEGVSTDLEQLGMNFSSVQRTMEDFILTRKAMNGEEVVNSSVEDPSGCPFHESSESSDDTGSCPVDNGILDFIEVTNRATFLLPPRELRALPWL